MSVALDRADVNVVSQDIGPVRPTSTVRKLSAHSASEVVSMSSLDPPPGMPDHVGTAAANGGRGYVVAGGFSLLPAGRPTFEVIPTSQPAARAFCIQSEAVRSGTSSSTAMSLTGGRSASAAVP